MPARCAARLACGSATCPRAPASTRISPSPRTSPSGRPRTGCQRVAAARADRRADRAGGLVGRPGPAGRAAVRRHAAEARRDRRAAAPPELLILDEPSTGVDPVSRSGLWSLIAVGGRRRRGGGAGDDLPRRRAARQPRCSCSTPAVQLAAGSPDEIVAAMPGCCIVAQRRSAPGGGRLARGMATRCVLARLVPAREHPSPGEPSRRTFRTPSPSRRSRAMRSDGASGRGRPDGRARPPDRTPIGPAASGGRVRSPRASA